MASNPNAKKQVWYLPGPFYQYVENVKELADRAGLRIIDANVTEDRSNEAPKTPKVTIRDEFKPKAEAKAKRADQADEQPKE
ncbi:hypothetical protein [Massilia sp. METH4]|uniref:hypothetical protein n=1 Tax=Massilia sp. METH4 TaxID=3123041 RepID=UPI0030CDA908